MKDIGKVRKMLQVKDIGLIRGGGIPELLTPSVTEKDSCVILSVTRQYNVWRHCSHTKMTNLLMTDSIINLALFDSGHGQTTSVLRE